MTAMDELVDRLNARCDAQPFHVAWYARDLAAGWTADRHGDVVQPSASIRKVAILLAALQAVHAGRLSLDARVVPDSALATTSGCLQWFQPGFEVSFRDLLLMMIIVSDNVATRHVVGAVGLEAVQALCADLGMTGTAMRTATPDYALPRDHGPGVANDTTARDQGRLLEAIARGSADAAAADRLRVTPALCALALDLMTKQRLRSRIPAWLPEGTVVANKTGSLGGNLNDVALVFDGERPRLVLTYLTDRVPETTPDGLPGRVAADTLAAWIARETWDAMHAG